MKVMLLNLLQLICVCHMPIYTWYLICQAMVPNLHLLNDAISSAPLAPVHTAVLRTAHFAAAQLRPKKSKLA